MTWGKVDDKLWGSPKWLGTGPRARALWVSGLSWCMDQLTDGHVPAHVISVLGGTRRDAGELVRIGLWEEADGGWQFHDWLDYQPSREQVLAERKAAAERQKRAREKAKAKRDAEVTRESRRDSQRDYTRESRSPRPDPTRPVNTYSPSVDTGTPRNAHEDEPPPDPYEPEMSVNAILAAAGLAQSEHRDSLVDLKGNGARNTTALVNALHRDGKLTGRIGEWRNERNLAAEATSRPKAGKRTTDDRVADAFALAEEFRAMEAGTNPNVIPLRQIEGA